MNVLQAIWQHMLDRTLELLPWFLVAILLAQIIQHLRIDLVVRNATKRRTIVAVVVTTLAASFTPFCACTIVPLIRGFLRAGMPLAIAMAFWVASPAMAPELFGLTAGALSLKVAVARLIGAILLGLGSAAVAHLLSRRGLIPRVLRESDEPATTKVEKPARELAVVGAGMPSGAIGLPLLDTGPGTDVTDVSDVTPVGSGCCGGGEPEPEMSSGCCGADPEPVADSGCCASSDPTGTTVAAEESVTWRALAKRSLQEVSVWDFGRGFVSDSWKLGRWMLLAIVAEALIAQFVPAKLFAGVLGGNLLLSVIIAALLSIPLYLNGISAIPIAVGLAGMGMPPAALTTFMLAGAVTTLPAMAAVSTIVTKRVFALYVGTAILGAIAIGLLSAPFIN